MKSVLRYGKRDILVTLIERERRTLAITVKPDMTVEIYMPKGVDKDRVMKRVSKKAKWIAKQLDYFKANAKYDVKKEYVSGETHSFMGRKYRLRVRKSIFERIKKSGGFIYLYTNRNGDLKYRKRMLYDWYKWQAEKIFASILNDRVMRLGKYGIKLPQFYIKRMKTRWGSCSPKRGRINLNLELIKTPKECIEYIIDHELLHFIHRNHDKKFYELLEKVTPDWKERKEKLEKYYIY
jgi:predicted metal-dependent hydrolase